MSTRTTDARVAAPLLEVFASIQGEGAYVGEPQVFVRLRGCPLRCRWCDTPGSWTLADGAGAQAPALGAAQSARTSALGVAQSARRPALGVAQSARIDALRGSHREPAWATPFQVACWIAEVEPGAPRTLSVTGGEPLLWPDFIRALKPMIGARRLHLETGGAHPRALAAVLDCVDHTSLDLKLPADLDAPVELAAAASEPAPRTRAEWAEVRAECLRLVRERDACAKLIVAGGREAREFDELLESVAEHAPRTPLIVQPVTATDGVRAPSTELLVAVAERARALSLRVRVVPQVHRTLGVP